MQDIPCLPNGPEIVLCMWSFRRSKGYKRGRYTGEKLEVPQPMHPFWGKAYFDSGSYQEPQFFLECYMFMICREKDRKEVESPQLVQSATDSEVIFAFRAPKRGRSSNRTCVY